MRKIIFIVTIILLLMITISIASWGIQIGDFQISSIEQLIKRNSQIDAKIAETNKLISIDYPEKNQALKDESKEMLEAKDQYLKLTANSSETEILNATMQEGYQIDFLYTRIGNHAKSKGVWTEMKIVKGDYDGVKDIKFTVEGSYVGITDFIYEIENDTKLNYRIKEFKLVPKDSTGSVLKATFVTKNIRIEGQMPEENIDDGNNEDTNSIDNTNTVDITNTIQ